MALLVRDSRIITPWLKNGAPTAGRIEALAMSGGAGYFTESIDVGEFTEGIAILLISTPVGTSPTIDCDIQYGFRDDNGQEYFVDSGDSFTQLTAAGMGFKKFTANFGKYVRFRIKIGGTATPGYTVTMKLAMKG